MDIVVVNDLCMRIVIRSPSGSRSEICFVNNRKSLRTIELVVNRSSSFLNSYENCVLSLNFVIVFAINSLYSEGVTFVNAHFLELLSLTISSQQTVNIYRSLTINEVEVSVLVVRTIIILLDVSNNTSDNASVLHILQFQEFSNRLLTQVLSRSSSFYDNISTASSEFRSGVVLGQLTGNSYFVTYFRSISFRSTSSAVSLDYVTTISRVSNPEGYVVVLAVVSSLD